MFWKRRKATPARVPVEEQLRNLEECGFEIAPGGAERLARAIEEQGRESIETRPYDLLLQMLGVVEIDEDGTSHPLAVGVWCFDAECIYAASDYVDVMRRLGDLSRDEVPLEDCDARFDDVAWVEFVHNGEKVHWDLGINGDWIDPMLFVSFARLLRASGSPRRLMVEDITSQEILLICPTQEEFRRLKGLSPERFGLFGFVGPRW